MDCCNFYISLCILCNGLQYFWIYIATIVYIVGYYLSLTHIYLPLLARFISVYIDWACFLSWRTKSLKSREKSSVHVLDSTYIFLSLVTFSRVISLWAWLLGGATGMESTGHFRPTRKTTARDRRKWRFRRFKVPSRHTHIEKNTHTRLLLQRMLDAELIF
jgi:hypothetical protein